MFGRRRRGGDNGDEEQNEGMERYSGITIESREKRLVGLHYA